MPPIASGRDDGSSLEVSPDGSFFPSPPKAAKPRRGAGFEAQAPAPAPPAPRPTGAAEHKAAPQRRHRRHSMHELGAPAPPIITPRYKPLKWTGVETWRGEF